jgi:hypothetical protein
LLFHLVKQYKRTLIATYGDLALEITPLNGPEFEVTGKVWGGSKHPFCDTGGVVCMVTEIEAGRSVGGGGVKIADRLEFCLTGKEGDWFCIICSEV